MKVIVSAELRTAPPVIPGIPGGMVTVYATFGDGAEAPLFSYYSDELTFRAEEFVGLTPREARELHMERDLAYLRSP